MNSSCAVTLDEMEERREDEEHKSEKDAEKERGTVESGVEPIS